MTGTTVTVSTGDVLTYTPPNGFSGTVNVFEASASDVVSNSNRTPITVTATVDATNTNTTNISFDVNCGLSCGDRSTSLNPTPEQGQDKQWHLYAAYCRGDKNEGIEAIETIYRNAYTEHLKLTLPHPFDLQQVQNTLKTAQQQTRVTPAALYMAFCPASLSPPLEGEIQQNFLKQNTPDPLPEIQTLYENRGYGGESVRAASRYENRLVLFLVSPNGEPIRRVVDTTRAEVQETAKKFRRTTTNRLRRTAYLEPAQQMYNWLLDPIEDELEALGIEHLIFLPDTGLRTIPLAALHDGQQFLIEHYSISIMPNVSASDTTPTLLKNEQVLAMGADTFTDQPALPAVPVELQLITEDLWQGKKYLNEQFTLRNLTNGRNQTPYNIIHLATHSNFLPGDLAESYIQLWDTRLSLDRLRTLGWDLPAVSMLVLSACRTAFGSAEVELGFTGLAIASGVKTAVGSLWNVDDAGTLGLMTEFYKQLGSGFLRAEALRQAQLSLLRQEVRLENGELVGVTENVPLPPKLAALEDTMLSHPFYWSAFIMVGNPF